jgi:hypothetical protein
MNLIGTHRRLFLVMASVAMDLAVAALLVGIFAGPGILSSMDLTDQTLWITSASPGFAVFVCAGAALCVLAGFVIAFMGLSNATMRSCVAGTVQSSAIRAFPCDEGYENYIYSTVTYEVDGRTHTSEGRHQFSSTSVDEIREKLAGISRGDRVLVCYKPGDPGVIDLDAPPKDTWGSVYFGGSLVLAGAILLFLAGSSFAS